jgi:FG-GAP repeat
MWMELCAAPRRRIAWPTSVSLALGVLLTAACSNRQPTSASTATVLANARSTEWTEQVIEQPGAQPDVPLEDSFASTLAVADGLALVGATLAIDPNGADEIDSGVVHRFTHADGAWTESERLSSPDPATGQRFGSAFAISDEFAAIGAREVAPNTGRVWVYQRDVAALQEPQVLAPSLAEAEGARFGGTLGLSGQTLFVGASGMSGKTAGSAESDIIQEGGVFVFQYDTKAKQWSGAEEPGRLLRPSGPTLDFALFGSSIALQTDLVVIGAPSEAPAGAVYVFRLDTDTSTWVEAERIAPEEVAAEGGFGTALAISGHWLFVGAPYDNGALGEPSGVVYAFERNNIANPPAGTSRWKAPTRILIDDPVAYDGFGAPLALTEKNLFVGARDAFVEDIQSGRVHVFDQTGANEHAPLFPENLASAVRFGTAMASYGSTLFVGSGVRGGPAYVYARGLGDACDVAADCSSGFCASGVCCDQACDGTCQTCRAAEGDGLKDGTCGFATPGTAPDNTGCPVSKDICGTTGQCGEHGACAFQPAGLLCQAVACVSAEVSMASYCDGLGQCPPTRPISCKPGYVCGENDACHETCKKGADCDEAAGYYCFESACVTGSRCVDDDTAAINEMGRRVGCVNSLCRRGACLSTCGGDDDCPSNLVCDDDRHTCVTAQLVAGKEELNVSDCSCRMVGRTGPSAQPILAALAALLVARRRKSRHPSARRPS